jgi:hypothetical protein
MLLLPPLPTYPSPLGRILAEGFDIPSIGVYLAPGVPACEFPHPAGPLPGNARPLTTLPGDANCSPRPVSLYVDVLQQLRTRLDLPTVAAEASIPADWPICLGFSPAVVSRPADWPATVRVTGYWWSASPPE